MAIQTLDQHIAKATHAQAIGPLKLGNDSEGKIGGHIKKTATRLRVSGLGVTLAVCLKKSHENQQQLRPVAEALTRVLKDVGATTVSTPEQLLEEYCKNSAAEIRRLQTYSEQILEWLAKWADTYKQKD
jgi:CRISPR/Cas system CMR-associated protein Cmr5 small subunit